MRPPPARRAGSRPPEATPGFAAALAAAAAEPALRKGERTRLGLLAAAARLLAKPGAEPGELQVAQVTAEAGVALGTFYRYFPERPAILAALVAAFADFLGQRLAAARQGAPGSRQRVEAATLAYVQHFRANPGLMRCLLDLAPASAAWQASFRRLNRAWNGRVAAALAARHGGDAARYLPQAYALGGMVDEFLATLYLRRDPALAALAGDEAGVAALLTDLWWRASAGPAPRPGPAAAPRPPPRPAPAPRPSAGAAAGRRRRA
jgi:AcrR family transcriptional regulator